MAAGALSLILALVGIVLPVVPQVPFAILAAFLFSKSSPRFHKWIKKNKYFGQPVKDWEEDRVIRPKLKSVSTVMMLAAAGFAHWKLDLTKALILDGIFLIAIIFVLTRKSKADK